MVSNQDEASSLTSVLPRLVSWQSSSFLALRTDVDDVDVSGQKSSLLDVRRGGAGTDSDDADESMTAAALTAVVDVLVVTEQLFTWLAIVELFWLTT